MVKQVVYSCFTDEQTKALRLDPQPQGTWLGSGSAQTLVREPLKPLLFVLPDVASLTALQGDQVAPGSNFSSAFPQDSRCVGRNSQWEINLCLQEPIIQSRMKRATRAWTQAKHWPPLPLPLPVEAAGKGKGGGGGQRKSCSI